MSNTGIPFVYQAISERENNHKGVGINTLGYICNTDSKGVFMSGIGNYVDGDSTGVYAAGLVNIADSDDDNNSTHYSTGVYLSSIANLCAGEANGVFLSAVNTARKSGKFVFQFGLYNHIGECDPDESKVIQIGLYNRAGEASSPFINIRGFGKKSKTTLDDYV